jgi:dTDP-4-amino-4,6-dideoxygalactose transaminase
MKAFSHLGYQAGDFPASEEIAGEILSLPMNIALTEEDIAGISAVVRDVLGKVQI